ncbi:MAG: UDP-N-acetylglucosamine 1-carboxyvinyltransferase, partial [Lachnospiraceae bacterium]
VRTCPYPGFPTDLQSQMMAVLCTALGVSRIQETVFENRFGTVQELIRMGADIQVQGDCAWITGTEMLQAARVCARDLRGGAALLIAGLEAVGETVVDGLSYIERGYEDVCRDFRLLGADVSKGKDNGG